MFCRQKILPAEYNTTINYMTLILLILGLGNSDSWGRVACERIIGNCKKSRCK